MSKRPFNQALRSAFWAPALFFLASPISQAMPVVNTSPASVTPAFGSTVSLNANVTVGLGTTFVWRRDGVEIINGGRYSGATTASLSIAFANAADNGSYQLTMTDVDGSESTTPATVTVSQNEAALDTFFPITVGSAMILDMLPLPDGRVLLACYDPIYGAASTSASGGLVVVQPNGQVSNIPAGVVNGMARHLHLRTDGKIVVGGDFSQIGAVARNDLALLNADLTLDTSFVSTESFDYSTLVSSDAEGSIYLGDFNGLRRLLPNGTTDASFGLSTNGAVYGMTRQQDGKVVVVGNFTTAGGVATDKIFRIEQRGALRDKAFASTIYNSLGPLGIDSQGRLLNTVIRGSAPYSIDLVGVGTGFTSPSFSDKTALRMLFQPDGRWLLTGAFTTPKNRIVRFNANGSLDTTFDVGLGFNNIVSASMIDHRGRIWATGDSITSYAGSPVGKVVALQGAAHALAFMHQPASQDAAPGSTVRFEAAVAADNGYNLRWHKNGVPLSDAGTLSGSSTRVLTISSLAGTDNGDYTLVATNPGGSITSLPASLFVIGSPFVSVQPVPVTVDTGGTASLTATVTGNGPMNYQWYHRGQAVVDGNGFSGATTATLTFTGAVTTMAGEYELRVANSLGDDTSEKVLLSVRHQAEDLAPGPQPSFSGSVAVIKPLSDGSYLVGGNFLTVTVNAQTISQPYLCRILSDGSLDQNFRPLLGKTANDQNLVQVNDIALDASGRVYVAGHFTRVTPVGSVSFVPCAMVCRFYADFSLDTTFNTAAGPNAAVLTLAPVGDGSVFIGGHFSSIGTVATSAVRYMARLKNDGSLDTTFTSRADGQVKRLIRRADGNLYVGGYMTNWERITSPPEGPNRIVLIQPTGARIKTFKLPASVTLPGGVNWLLLDHEGNLVADGFYRMNGQTGQQYSSWGDFADVLDACLAPVQGQMQSPAIVLGKMGGVRRFNYESSDFFTERNPPMSVTFATVSFFKTGYASAVAADSQGRIFAGGDFRLQGESENRLFAIFKGGISRTVTGVQSIVNFTASRPVRWGEITQSGIASAQSTSRLPVSFEVVSGPATINGNLITYTGAGQVVLRASQAGSDEYAPAAPVELTVNVLKGNQFITLEYPIDRPLGSAPVVLHGRVNPDLPITYSVISGPATVSGNVVTLTGAPGIVEIKAEQPGDVNWNAAAPVTRMFRVTNDLLVPVKQTITFTPPTRVFQSETVQLSAISSASLPVAFTLLSGPATLVGSTLTFTSTGTVKVRASQAGNASVQAAPSVDRIITVSANPTTLTLIGLQQTYDGQPKPVSTLGGSGVPVITYKVNGANTTNPPTNAGSYPVEALIGAGATAVRKSGTLVIAKAPLIVIPDDQRKLIFYHQNFEMTYRLEGLKGSDIPTTALNSSPLITTTARSNSPRGRYPINARGGASVNYSMIYRTGTLTIESFAGSYEALLVGGSPVQPLGKLELTVPATSGSFSGRLFLRSEPTPIRLAGDLLVSRDTNTASASFLKIENGNHYDIIFSLPLDGAGTAEVNLFGAPLASSTEVRKLLVLPTGRSVPHAGAYTLILPQTASVLTDEPAGVGHAAGTLDAKGVLKLVGMLADGTKFTTSLLPDVQEDPGYRLYLQPYLPARTGSYIAGEFALKSHIGDTRKRVMEADAATFTWAKAPRGADSNYRAGFGPTKLSVLLDPWLPPVTRPTVITLAQRLGLTGPANQFEVLQSATGSEVNANLPASVALGTTGSISVITPVANSTKWKVALTPATGLFSGSFELTDAGKKRTVPFTGMMRQLSSTDSSGVIGNGHFILPALPGAPSNESLSGEVRFDLP